MCLAHKKETFVVKSEGGFVLIAALMGIMILLAVGYFALTVSTSDLRIAARLVGERRAFSAAEAGVQATCLTFDPTMAALTNQAVDAVGDPQLRYSVAAPSKFLALPSMNAVGADITYGKAWMYQNFTTQITGTDGNYGSSATIAVGYKFGPVPDDPSYH